MIELIVVMVLAGVLGAVGVARFFDRAGFDADSFTEQTRAMLRYAQKMAIAQNRPVYVHLDGNSIGLCLQASAPCAAASQVPAPSGANSGSKATQAYCRSGAWYCEGRPPTLSYSLSRTVSAIYFDALGRPFDAAGAAQFAGLTISIAGDGATHAVAVAPETGYVY